MRRARDIAHIVNLREGPRDWYRVIRNQADGPTDVLIYDEIGFYGITAQDFVNELAGISGPLVLRLNSPGGEVFEGITIYNALLARTDPVTVYIDGIAASIASVIAMAASPGQLFIAKRAQMMIHDGLTMAIGNAAEMRALADQLDEQSDNIAGVYADRTGKPASFWRDQMRANNGEGTFYIGQAAVDAGLADALTPDPAAADADGKMAAQWDLSLFSNADGNHAPMTGTHAHSHPAYGSQGGDATHAHEHAHDGDASHDHDHSAAAADSPTDSLRCAHGHPIVNADADGPQELGNGWVQDPDGTVRFDPDGDGDDDSTPDGDTDGDYWQDGRLVQAIPPCPAMTDATTRRFLNADVDNSDWDASKAWHNGAESDDPATFYAGICAGEKTDGDPATQAHWALPYKYTPSSPPNAAGVRNALGRLPQTQGLKDPDGTKALLQRLMKQINPDYEPADELDIGELQALLISGLERPPSRANEGGRK